MLRLAELAAKALLDQSLQPKYIARVDNTLWESIREGGGGGRGRVTLTKTHGGLNNEDTCTKQVRAKPVRRS